MFPAGTTDQAVPFQCSARSTGLFWAPSSCAPTAQQSEPVTQSTPHSRDAFEEGGATSGPVDQVDPFQWSTRALGWELFPSEEKTPPTAQQFQALVQVLPIRRLLSVGPLLGLVMMFHPEGLAELAELAARAVGGAMASVKTTAVRTPRQGAVRQCFRRVQVLDMSSYRQTV